MATKQSKQIESLIEEMEEAGDRAGIIDIRDCCEFALENLDSQKRANIEFIAEEE